MEAHSVERKLAAIFAADVERDLIRTRTAEGTEARAAGRPSKLTHAQKAEARRRAEGTTLAELARSYDVDSSTISRIATPSPRPSTGLK